METKTYFGFEFVKIGVAKVTNEILRVIYRDKPFSSDLILDLIHPDFALAEQSTYLVFVGEQLKYAGQYSGTFEERWLKRRKYIWHSDNVDFSIRDSLCDFPGTEVSVWLTLDPYLASTPFQQPLNVNKALEQQIIKEFQPAWNTIGRATSTQGKRVKDICRRIWPESEKQA